MPPDRVHNRYYASCLEHPGNDPRCPVCLMAALLELLFLVEGDPLGMSGMPAVCSRDIAEEAKSLWLCVQYNASTVAVGASAYACCSATKEV